MTFTIRCPLSLEIVLLVLSSLSLNCSTQYLPKSCSDSTGPYSTKVTFRTHAWYWVRVLFHNLISPISIYTRRAFWARLSMLHVIEFNLWPKSSAPQSIEK